MKIKEQLNVSNIFAIKMAVDFGNEEEFKGC
jgi:hypothetical protein